MYNSQLSVTDVTKAWKVLIAVLSLTIGWQYATAQTKTGMLPANSTTQQEAQATQTVPVATLTPEQSRQKKIEEDYENARYLSVVQTNERIRYSKDDLFCLAKNIYHEAGNQSTKGKVAVAQVTINRTRDPKFAGTVCDVVMAHKQFSWTLNRRLRWSRPNNEMWRESVRIARDALENGFRVKGLEDALYYHANYVRPGWRHVDRLAQIGAHIFYQPA